jgi:enoyl-CoA hydratase/carnithine racemase
MVSTNEGIATVTFNRGKVNAMNEPMVEELTACFEELESDSSVRVVIVTGRGSFFSFGFDIPGFLSYSRESFTRYLTKFAGLYTLVYLYPKPVVAALNGHTIAGACMLATACDYRIMVEGKAKISLNEIGFGSSVTAGSVEMLRACVGTRNAEKIVCTGAMFNADDALRMGLVDQKSAPENIQADALAVAHEFAARDAQAFRSIKLLLRKQIADDMRAREKDSIAEFVDIWYSESTWERLKEIKIRD